MVNKFLTKLSHNLIEILDNDNEYHDVTIEVGNDPYVKIFRAHMVILNYRSPYLRRILSTIKKKNDKALVHIKLTNIPPEIFQIVLRYIYGGRLSLLPLKEYDTLDIIKILIAACELSLQELIIYLQSFLIENKKNWMEQNFYFIYQTSFENNSFLELQKYCTDLISKEPNKIFKSPNFSSISEKLLISIIQNDNLQMREIQIWEYILKWGISKNPELPADVKNYSKDDFKILKNTLKHCIPFIKFYNLTSKEFMDRVLPYKKILPKELYEDLLKSFLNLLSPNSKLIDARPKPKEIELKNVDSKIITHQHAKLILKWVNKLEIMNKFFEFKLLFRASRDGFTREKFHEICDNQSNTITIVKMKDSKKIIGGYNPIEWKSDDTWSVTKDSFIFSFKNSNKIDDYILSRVINGSKAIYNSRNFGPLFGEDDLTIWGSKTRCCSFKNSYEKLIRKAEGYFSIEECEIFKIGV